MLFEISNIRSLIGYIPSNSDAKTLAFILGKLQLPSHKVCHGGGGYHSVNSIFLDCYFSFCRSVAKLNFSVRRRFANRTKKNLIYKLGSLHLHVNMWHVSCKVRAEFSDEKITSKNQTNDAKANQEEVSNKRARIVKEWKLSLLVSGRKRSLAMHVFRKQHENCFLQF